MTTLNTIASQIIRKLSGGDQSVDSVYDRRDVYLRIQQALAELIKLESLERRSMEGDRRPSPTYIGTYFDIAIAEGRYGLETDIPEFYLSLPYNAGLNRISLSSEPLVGMIPRHNPSISNTLEAGGVEGNMSYWVEGLKVYFDKHVQITTKKTVDMRLVVASPSNVDVDDALPVLPEQVAQLIDIVVSRMSKIAQEDLNAENVDPSPVLNKKEQQQTQ